MTATLSETALVAFEGGAITEAEIREVMQEFAAKVVVDLVPAPGFKPIRQPLAEPFRGRVQAWVDLLRSGKYEQIVKRLWDRSLGMCCLGVMTQYYNDNSGNPKESMGGVLPSPTTLTWFGFPGMLETSCCEGQGCKVVTADVQLGTKPVTGHGGGGVVTAAMCNDSFRLNFNQIATLIEAAYL